MALLLSAAKVQNKDQVLSHIACLGIAGAVVFDSLKPLALGGSTYLACPGGLLMLFLGAKHYRSAGSAHVSLRLMFTFLLYLLTVSLVGLFFTSGLNFVSGKSLESKVLTTTLVLTSWFGAVWFGASVARQPQSIKRLFGWLLALLVAGWFLDVLGMIPRDASSWLHFYPGSDSRPRGFKAESSFLAIAVSASLAPLAIFVSKRRVLYVMFPLYLASMYFSTSRGGLWSSLCALVMYLVLRNLRTVGQNWPRYLAIACSLLAFALVAPRIMILYRVSSGSIANIGSDITRTTWNQVAIDALSHYPCGLGFGFYYTRIRELLVHAEIAVNIRGTRDFTYELVGMIYGQSDRGLGPKTLLQLWIVWGGWLGGCAALLLLASVVDRALRLDNGLHGAATLLVLSTVLGLLSYHSGILTYETGLALGAILGFTPSRANTVEEPKPSTQRA